MKVIFECFCKQTQWGETLRVVGNTPELGLWSPSAALMLSTSPEAFPRWRSPSISFQKNGRLEYKFVILTEDGSNAKWENIDNRQIAPEKLPDNDTAIIVSSYFGNTEITFSTEEVSATMPSFAPFTQNSFPQDSQLEASQEWMGREVRFVKTHSGLRALEQNHPVNTVTCREAYKPIEPLLRGSVNAGSYLLKLQLVEKELQRLDDILNTSGKKDENQIKSTKEGIQLLAAISVYLTFVKSGAIPCREDGGHHRPHHHAGVASSIFSNLIHVTEKLRSDPTLSNSGHGEAIILLIRRIFPLLPSFAESFTCSVPLTRIRDIAHRNDIPQDLKAEIKHTLQNKLHRCAGPEDLIAANKMLQRLLPERHQYSEGFISEFLKFHEELKEFFNARSLVDRLTSVRGFNLSDEMNSAISRFLTNKPRVQSDRAPTEAFLSLLASTVKIRECLVSFRNSTTLADAKIQEVWLTDIATEQFAFTLISQLVSRITGEKLEWGKLKLHDQRWLYGLETLMASVRHVEFSAFHSDECKSIHNLCELLQSCWKDAEGWILKGFTSIGLSLNDSKLLVRSALERALRLTESYTETVTQLFPPIVREIGKAVGVPSHAVEVFAEADVRANIVFQLSRLSSSLLNQVAASLGETGVEVIVEPKHSDTVTGVLIDLIDMWKLPTAVAQFGEHAPSIIIRLAQASGDEEVAGLASEYKVAGIILMHSIPHLSHLSIRARQERLPFVSIVNPDSELSTASQNLVGKNVQLRFTPNGAELKEFKTDLRVSRQSTMEGEACGNGIEPILRRSDDDTVTYRTTRITTSADIVEVHTKDLDPNSSLPLLNPGDLAQNCLDKVGAKAAVCGKLMNLGETSGGTFISPSCWVIPFGAMETVLRQQDLYDSYCKLLNGIDDLSLSFDSPEVENHLEKLEALLTQLLPNRQHLAPVVEAIENYAKGRTGSTPDSIPFIARSSANVEDLAGMSAAGLYESIANINPIRSFDQFARSIAAVWASLHSRRAIYSRRIANVSQQLARMAVLIQDLTVPYLSFVAHTDSPVPRATISKLLEQSRQHKQLTPNPKQWVYIELALGLGEILASGATRGSPFRVLIHKETGLYILLSLASFGIQYAASNHCSSNIGTNKESSVSVATQFVDINVTDYTRDIFTLNSDLRALVVAKILAACLTLEQKLHEPQDIEGSIILKPTVLDAINSTPNFSVVERAVSLSSMKIDDSEVQIVIVQSRPQPL